jgi:hypothetical protein
VRAAAALLLALPAASGWAATAYVTDELVLGVYAAQSTEGARLATLHSGASVETLAVYGDATQVQLADGTTGWVKSSYLTLHEPATLRVKQLQEQLDRSRALPTAAASSRQSRADAGAALDDKGASHAAWAWAWGLSLIAALAAGFWLGYATLARRIKYKFGGIKVY